MTTVQHPDEPQHTSPNTSQRAMPSPPTHGASTVPIGAPDQESQQDTGHGRGHGLMMLARCVPMLLIAFALVATGAAGAGAILYALLCTAMMAAMMFAMPGRHKH